jgi:hypothetical protein
MSWGYRAKNELGITGITLCTHIAENQQSDQGADPSKFSGFSQILGIMGIIMS